MAAVLDWEYEGCETHPTSFEELEQDVQRFEAPDQPAEAI